MTIVNSEQLTVNREQRTVNLFEVVVQFLHDNVL